MSDEPADFRARVEAACRDLPEPQRVKVIEAVDAWLEERGAGESGGGVALALGDAETYAAELRAAMGLPERPVYAGHGWSLGRVPRWVLAVVAVVLLVSASLTTWAVTRSNGTGRSQPPVSGKSGSVPTVVVPNVLSMTAQAATRELREAGLRTRLEFVASPGQLGHVVAQGPAVTTRVARGSMVVIKVASTWAQAGAFPPCHPLSGEPAATVRIVMRNISNQFTRDCYYALAGKAFQLQVTNRIFALADHQPIFVQLIISLQSHPAFHPVPGRPGFSVGTTQGAAFVADRLTAPQSRTFTVPPLPAGSYAIQSGAEAVASLIVQ
jgi:hypothetical protein